MFLKWRKWSHSVASDSSRHQTVQGSSVHGILQARILEWAAISSGPQSQKCPEPMKIVTPPCFKVHVGGTPRQWNPEGSYLLSSMDSGQGWGSCISTENIKYKSESNGSIPCMPTSKHGVIRCESVDQGARDSAQAHYASGVAGLMPVKWSLPEGQEGFWSRQSWAFRVNFLWGQRKGEDGQIMGPQPSSIRKTYSDCLSLKPHHGV